MGIGYFADTRYYLDVDCAWTSSNVGANQSNIYWRQFVRKTGGTGASSGANAVNRRHTWANVGDLGSDSGFGYNFTGATPKDDVYREGNFTLGHDANGYANYQIGGDCNLYNGAISLGTATAYSDVKAAPRIPIAPSAPTPVSVDQITPTTARFIFTGNADGGAPINGWQAQIAEDAGFTQNVQTVSSSGTTVFTGLTPGRQHWVRARGSNTVRGWGAWSGALTFQTISGAYWGVGGGFVGTEVLFGDPATSTYKSCEVWVADVATATFVRAQ